MGSKRKKFDLDIILDVVFDEGLFFLRLQNIGTRPARDVSVSFDREILTPHDGRLLNDLRLFKAMPFLAPNKRIDVFAGTSAAYFRAGQPTRFRATVQYLDATGDRHSGHIDHDLSVYADLGTVRFTSAKSPDPANF